MSTYSEIFDQISNTDVEFFAWINSPECEAMSESAAQTLNLDQFEYIPFDASKLRDRVLQIANARKVGRQELFRKIIETVFIGLLKGNVRKDQLAKMSNQEAKRRIIKAAALWGIYLRKNKYDRHRLSADDLSFPRFISVFPQVASKCLMRGDPGKFSGNLPAADASRFPAQTHRLPAAMKHTGFAGLIPNDCLEIYKELLTVCCLGFMAEFGILVRPYNSRKSFSEIYMDQCALKRAAMSGKLTDRERKMCLTAFDLVSVDNINTMISVANSVMLLLKSNTVFAIEDVKKHMVNGVLRLVDEPEYSKMVDAQNSIKSEASSSSSTHDS